VAASFAVQGLWRSGQRTGRAGIRRNTERVDRGDQIGRRLALAVRVEGEGRMTGRPPRARRWTLDEVKQLEEMLNAGKTAPEIARELKRTAQAIYARLQRLYRKRARLLVLKSA
jgi:hypothetical protein